MFERYTESARRTLYYARYEVSQLGGTSVDSEHLLLGMARESGAIVGGIFAAAQISYQGIRQELEALATARPKVSTSVEIPFSDNARRILQDAADEANRLAQGHVGTEHLLVGLLRERGSFTERYLAQRGVSVDRVLEQIRVERVSSAADSTSRPTHGEALMALERVTSLLTQIRQSSAADVGEFIEGIELELQLVERALLEDGSA